MRKGFTLIELLAVIVILSIIAIITVSLIGSVIEESRKKALKQSAYGLIEAANYYAINNDGLHEFEFENGNQISTKKLDYKGKIENGKVVLLKDGLIALCIDNGTYYAYKGATENEITIQSGTCEDISLTAMSNEEYTAYIPFAAELEPKSLKITGNTKNSINLANDGNLKLVITGKNLLDMSNLKITDSRQILNEDNTLTLNGNFTGGGGGNIPFGSIDVYIPFYSKSSIILLTEYFSGTYIRNDSNNRITSVSLVTSRWQDGLNFYAGKMDGNKYHIGYLNNSEAAGYEFSSLSFKRTASIHLANDNSLENDITFDNYRVGLMILNAKMSECKNNYYTAIPESNVSCAYEPYKERIYNIELKDVLGNKINGIGEGEILEKKAEKWGITSGSNFNILNDKAQEMLNSIILYSGINNVFVKDDVVPTKLEIEYYK